MEDIEGRILLTSLTNHVTPFIRYDIGDRGSLRKNTKCSCGCHNDILQLKSGRSNDYVLFKNGDRGTSYIFVRILDMVNYRTDQAVIQYMIEQTDYGKFTVMLRIDDEIGEEDVIEAFYESVDDANLKDAVFDFQFREEMPSSCEHGKYAYFRNRMKI